MLKGSYLQSVLFYLKGAKQFAFMNNSNSLDPVDRIRAMSAFKLATMTGSPTINDLASPFINKADLSGVLTIAFVPGFKIPSSFILLCLEQFKNN